MGLQIYEMAYGMSLCLHRDDLNRNKTTSFILCCGNQSRVDSIPMKCTTKRKSPLHVVWDLTLITGDHHGDCTFKHVAKWEEWTEANTTMQGGPLTSSAVRHITKIPPSVSLSTVQHSLMSTLLYYKQTLDNTL